MPRFDLVHKKIGAARSTSVLVTSAERREIGRVKRDQREYQRSLRKTAKVHDNPVDRMRGDKYGWTFTRVHGGREYRVLDEPCHICGVHHGARLRPWWHGLCE